MSPDWPSPIGKTCVYRPLGTAVTRGYRNSVLNLDYIAKVDRANGPVVLAADDDAMPEHEATVSNALGRHFRCCDVASPECFGFVWQFRPFTVPDIFIIEEMKIKSFHRASTNALSQRPNG